MSQRLGLKTFALAGGNRSPCLGLKQADEQLDSPPRVGCATKGVVAASLYCARKYSLLPVRIGLRVLK